MRVRNRDGISIFCEPFGARFAPNKVPRLVGETRANPSTQVGAKARRKLLKTERLLGFQFGSKMSCFLAGSGLAEMGNTLGQ